MERRLPQSLAQNSVVCGAGCRSGEKGCATLEDDRIVRWEFEGEHKDDQKIRNLKAGAIVGGSTDPGAIGFEGYRILVEDLIHSIIDKRPPT